MNENELIMLGEEKIKKTLSYRLGSTIVRNTKKRKIIDYIFLPFALYSEYIKFKKEKSETDLGNENQQKLSIIIPTYNCEKFIEKTLNSIIEQSYKNLEIIVVDDRSQDNTVSIVQRLSKVDTRIRLIQKIINSGSGTARNIGIEASSGHYVTFVDGDDYIFDKNYFADCLRFIKKEKANVVITPYLRERNGEIKQDIIEINKKNYTGLDAASNYLARKFGTHAACGKIFTKLALKEAKFIEHGLSQDVLFVGRALCSSKKVSILDRYGYVYRNDNISSWRPTVLSDLHIYSSLRLLVEILHFKKYIYLQHGKKLNISAFLRTWNKDHGKRLIHYLNNGKITFNGIRLIEILNKESEIIEHIESEEIRNWLMNGYLDCTIESETKIRDIDIDYLKTQIKKLTDETKKIVGIYVSHLSKGGLERVASNLGFILDNLGYDVVYFLDNTKSIDYEHCGSVIKAELNSEVKSYLEKCKCIFDFKYKKAGIENKFVRYCINHHCQKYIPTIHNTQTCNDYFEEVLRYLTDAGKNPNDLAAILCVSEAVKREFIRLYGEWDTLKVIYNCINIEKIWAKLTKEKVSEKEFFIFEGRLDKTDQKGIDILIKGFLNSIHAENYNLILAGSGQLEKELLKYIANHRNKHCIKILGFRKDIHSVISQAKALLAPSRWEGFSMVHLESLAVGVPVISSRCGGAEEVIQDGVNGYLFTTESISEFETAIDKVIMNKPILKSNCIHSACKFDSGEYQIKIQNLLSDIQDQGNEV